MKENVRDFDNLFVWGEHRGASAQGPKPCNPVVILSTVDILTKRLAHHFVLKKQIKQMIFGEFTYKNSVLK